MDNYGVKDLTPSVRIDEEGMKLWSVRAFCHPCNASEVVISRVDEPGPSLTPATHASSITLT
jgi:hypothetical protein